MEPIRYTAGWDLNRLCNRNGDATVRRYLILISLAAFALAGAINLKSYAEDIKSSVNVKIDNFSFSPAEVTVPVGASVTWTNGDDIPHTVAASNKSFRSKVMDTDQSFSFTFTASGEYEYFCSLHPHMKGKVIVR